MLRVPLGAKFHCATLNARFLHAERFLPAFGDSSDVLPDLQAARWLGGSDMFHESVGGVNRNLEFRIECQAY